MRVTFILPGLADAPVGGLKVAYELANRLARRGHEVVLLHAVATMRTASLRRVVRRTVAGVRVPWFDIDDRIRVDTIGPADPAAVPDGDALVAVGWRTVALVNDARPTAGRKLQFIQGYMATVEGAPGEVDAAWRLPLDKIVIAGWLEAKVREVCGSGPRVHRMPGAIDHTIFKVATDPELREPASIALLWHQMPTKGTAAGIEALNAVAAGRPGLRATLFGTGQAPALLPSWATYRRAPADLPALYNQHAIFLHPSSLEGWPLTPAEAMASGCAVVGYGNDGIREYATDERNALLVAVDDVAGLAAAVTRLIDDVPLRLTLARQGLQDIRRYDWAAATDAFEAALTDF